MGETTGASAGTALTAADLRGRSEAWADRRSEPRMPCARQVSILRGGAQTVEGFQPVGLFDCSARGVGIVCAEPMEVGDQFLAELSLEGVMLATYTVRHCTRAADGRHYKIGAELVGLIGKAGRDPQAALKALLGRDD
jgi:hypothetical protein